MKYFLGLMCLILTSTYILLYFRKRDKIEVEEETAPCAYCSHPLPLSHLDCPQCKSTLPYCIVTVRTCGFGWFKSKNGSNSNTDDSENENDVKDTTPTTTTCNNNDDDNSKKH